MHRPTVGNRRLCYGEVNDTGWIDMLALRVSMPPGQRQQHALPVGPRRGTRRREEEGSGADLMPGGGAAFAGVGGGLPCVGCAADELRFGDVITGEDLEAACAELFDDIGVRVGEWRV